jgi:hypothetical protein
VFQASDVSQMTGLSRSQLREWSGKDRRHIILPDIEPAGPGRHAIYGWQTVLVLRILKVIHDDWAAEVTAWAPAMQDLRSKLERAPFPALWGTLVHFPSRTGAVLCRPGQSLPEDGGLLLPLDPHLTILATRLSQPRPDQLPLFAALVVSR